MLHSNICIFFLSFSPFPLSYLWHSYTRTKPTIRTCTYKIVYTATHFQKLHFFSTDIFFPWKLSPPLPLPWVRVLHWHAALPGSPVSRDSVLFLLFFSFIYSEFWYFHESSRRTTIFPTFPLTVSLFSSLCIFFLLFVNYEAVVLACHAF